MSLTGMFKGYMDKQRHNRRIADYKQLLLESLSFLQLKKMAQLYGVKVSSHDMNSLFGAGSEDEDKLSTKDYVACLMVCNMKEVIDFCKREKLKGIENIIKGYEEYMAKGR